MSDTRIEQFRRIIADDLRGTPGNYADRCAVLKNVHDAMRVAIAGEFGPMLNEEAALRPQSTYEDKKRLAKWFNAELRSFGLAIKCPKTGKPANLLASPTGSPGIGRFQIEIIDENNIPKRPVTSVELPKFEFMLADLSWGKNKTELRRK